MKKFLAIFIVTFFSGFSLLTAQSDVSKLVGVWQQHERVTDNDGHMRLVHLPVWKVLTGDGVFYTFLIANKDGVSIKTNEGTYKVVNDSVYEENISGSITVPALVGTTNTMRYNFAHPDVMNVVYRLPKAQRDAREIWIRLKLELPQQR